MKKIITSLILLLLICIFPCKEAFAEENQKCGDHLTWSISGDTLTISGTGEMYDYDINNQPWYSKRYEIKNVVIKEGVTYIGGNAFHYHTNIISVDIADTVKVIGNDAFSVCNSLSSIEANGAVEIKDYAFASTNISSFHIPKGLMSLGDAVFWNTALETLTVEAGNTVFSAKDGVLYKDNGRTLLIYPMAKKNDSFVIPDKVTKIEADAFEDCTKLKNLTLSKGMESVGVYSLAYCEGLEKVVFPENIKRIEEGAFNGCKSLKSIDLKNVEYIGYQAFWNCSALTSVLLGEGLITIDAMAFDECTSLKNLTVPKSVIMIESYAIPEWVELNLLNKGLRPFGANGYRMIDVVDIDVKLDYQKSFEILEILNKERQKAGLKPLVMDEKLLEAAMQRACELIFVFDHNRPDGRSFGSVCEGAFGENIQYGFSSPAAVMQAWMNSSGHRENMLFKGWTKVGIGCVSLGGTHFWVQNFGDGDTSGSCSKPANKNATMQIEMLFKVKGYQGEMYDLTPEIYFENDNIEAGESIYAYLGAGVSSYMVANSCVQWTSDNPSVAKIDENGKITGVKSGTATITAKLNYSSFTKKIYVDAKPQVTRIYGNDRYQTAFKAANVLKDELGGAKFDTIIVASGNTFADALPGSYLAAKEHAPILLISKNQAATVREYITKNLKSGGKVYVLGGEVAVDSEWMKGIEYTRLGGASRYETNLLILKAAGVNNKAEIMVCTGNNFADSLSVSATGKPILMVNKNLNAGQMEFLNSISDEKYFIIGGEVAVVKNVEDECAKQGKTKRIAGDNRYTTSVKVAKEFFGKPDHAVLAYAENFPDGLSAGPLAYTIKAPLILTKTGIEFVAADYTIDLGIRNGFVLGGPTLISDRAVKNVFQMSNSDVIKTK